MKIQQMLVFLFIALVLSMRVLGEGKVNDIAVELEIKPARASYELGRKIPINFKIKNTSQVALDIDFVFHIKGVLPSKAPRVLGPINLKPGEEYKAERDLNKYVQFSGPGEFEITYEGTIGEKDWFWNAPLGDGKSDETGTAVKTGSFKLKIEKSTDLVEQEKEAIQFEIKPANPSYKFGEKIPILLKVKNVSQSAVNVGFDARSADAWITFSVRGSPPKTKVYPSISYSPSIIKPGEEYKAEIDLNKFIKFPGPGEFEITYAGTINYDLENDPTPPDEKVEQGVNGSGAFKLKIENPTKK